MAESSLAKNPMSKAIVVWYDPTAYEKHNERERELFEATFRDRSFIHNSEESAKQMFSREYINKPIILITSGSLGKTFVPVVHHYENLQSIYIFCGTPEYHRTWTQDYPKVMKNFQVGENGTVNPFEKHRLWSSHHDM